MKKFNYLKPQTVDEALELKEKLGDKAKILAGGTDVLVQMKRGLIFPEYLISLKAIEELHRCGTDAEHFFLGPLITLRSLEEMELIKNNCRVLGDTAQKMASPQIRYLATIGGNICNASPSADLAPPLIALGANLEITGPEGKRICSLEDFYTGPGETVLKHNEVLTKIIIPKSTKSSHICYLKQSIRKAHDIALVGVSVMVRISESGKQLQEARIVLGAVAPTPIRATAAEELLCGGRIEQKLIVEAAELAAKASRPIDDIRSSAAYRRKIVKALVKRALEQLLLKGGGEDETQHSFKHQRGAI